MEALKANRRVFRVLLPFVLAVACLVATAWCGPVLTIVLLIVALGLALDGVTIWFSRTGGMSQHRQ